MIHMTTFIVLPYLVTVSLSTDNQKENKSGRHYILFPHFRQKWLKTPSKWP